MREPLRHVELDGYTLQTFDTGEVDTLGKSRIAYEFKTPAGEMLFNAEDFHASPCHAIDSDECLRSLLGFLTLSPGDTESDYFADYTPEQMAFAEGDAEQLKIWSFDDEDGGLELNFKNLDDWEDYDNED